MKQSILLVDDKLEIAKIIMLYLSSLYEVTYKENPIKAIAKRFMALRIQNGIVAIKNAELEQHEPHCSCMQFFVFRERSHRSSVSAS